MLFQIQKDLVQNKVTKLTVAAENDSVQYKKLKKEYLRLSATAQKQLTPQLKVYLLLIAVSNNDLAFAQTLIAAHSYNQMNDTGAKIALGRFYGKYASFHSKVVECFLPVFNEGKLDTSNDLKSLFAALYETAHHNDCPRVLQFAVSRHPDILGWKIENLLYEIRTNHLRPQNKELVVGNLKYLYAHCKKSDEFCNLAVCTYNAGYFNDAIKIFDIALQKTELNLKPEKNTFVFNSSKCLDSANEMLDILEQHKIQAFPAFGSLLGLVRDGKFMEYDKDADLGIFVNSHDDIQKIVRTLCESPKFTAPSLINESKEQNTWCVGVIDNTRGIPVDLFFFYNESTHFEAGAYTTCGILKWQFTPFELVQRELAGKIYWIPNNAEQHLTELYADWRKPVEVWDSLVNCPNLMPESKNVVLFYGLMRLYNALQNGKTKKALNYYETLTTKWGMRFSSEADGNVRKLLGLSE